MKEEIFKISDSNTPVVEAVIKDENINFMHMVFKGGESLKTHYSNANVYMTVIKGILSLSLDDSPFKKYEENTVIKIPFNTKMMVQNHDAEILEIYVIKSPAPGTYYTN
ncbi:MAG: cupin domain-containing protein [Sphaerochaetaceae bacterium]|nr:cupin domain-containing protein [Sphaerochaetaceae bacterium]